MTRDSTRRRFLECGVALGTVALAGCAELDPADHPPVDADESDFLAIADIDRPTQFEDIPLTIDDERVEEGVDRVESLLEPIPDDLAAEIPNEAVRTYVDEERDEARERLEELEADPTDYERLTSLRAARRRAGEAEGAYAAATADRERSDVHDDVDALEETLSTAEDDLRRIGSADEPHHAVVVYDAIGDRLNLAERSIEQARRPLPGASAVDAVGQLAERYETASAAVEQARYLMDRQAEAGDRPLDDEFESTAATLLEELESRLEDVPLESEEPAQDLFDAPVEGTPREKAGWTAVRRVRSNYDRAEDAFESGQLAQALRSLHTVETARRVTGRLQSAVDDGELERPDDADDLEAAKRDAVDAIETTRAETPYPYLVGSSLGMAVSGVRNADRRLERYAEHEPDRTAVGAIGEYAYAAAWARALPEATEWFVDALR